MKRRFSAWFALALAASVNAAAPQPDDYAQGVRMTALSDRPLIEVLLPDSVYRTVTRPDLADVRVFNADGAPVPHAFCASAIATEPVVTQESLPVFELRAGAQPASDGAQLEVQTPGGTQVKVQETPKQTTTPVEASAETSAHVIDARAITNALRSLEFDWSSPDGASQAEVRIEASDDLDRWRTVVGRSAL